MYFTTRVDLLHIDSQPRAGPPLFLISNLKVCTTPQDGLHFKQDRQQGEACAVVCRCLRLSSTSQDNSWLLGKSPWCRGPGCARCTDCQFAPMDRADKSLLAAVHEHVLLAAILF